MRKLMISLAAAGTALAFATPAAAQYYPQQSYNYGQQYGGYGYNGYGNNGWGQMRALQARIDSVENQIRRLDRRDAIPDNRADRLRNEAQNGLNPYEVNAINGRIAWLERQVQYSLANRYGGYGHNGYGDRGYGDRNRDHDRDHDGRWDHDND